ncbi:MAG TPA: AbrB/MazE/SpoVT family DNA-binding domain-containing protein [Clostridia bacterium]|jgi:transcriptional pleiotropic regulator of transition state genes|nr:MAG: Transition state regulatory protein AbrB [Firmicutes bacterium ADurb.Bin146]HOD93400.1 AbrB/MazE/SpoVT family DNA-binding domain-containing protein [Clostridia bacterium]HQM38898.1 AbrB/MazE/SpoVT family DNA-binding domain-containing protein [Clostridia bacterium]
MKSAGVVRKIDELGRIVVPIELRKSLNIGKREAVEISLDNDCIMIKKFEPGCCFCGSTEDIQNFNGNKVCSECVEELSSASSK